MIQEYISTKLHGVVSCLSFNINCPASLCILKACRSVPLKHLVNAHFKELRVKILIASQEFICICAAVFISTLKSRFHFSEYIFGGMEEGLSVRRIHNCNLLILVDPDWWSPKCITIAKAFGVKEIGDCLPLATFSLSFNVDRLYFGQHLMQAGRVRQVDTIVFHAS